MGCYMDEDAGCVAGQPPFPYPAVKSELTRHPTDQFSEGNHDMEWQDVLFAVGGFILAVTVLPTLRSDDKPAWPTSISLAIILAVYAGLFATLDLALGAIGAGLQSILWGWVVVQTRRARRRAAAGAATALVSD